MKPALGRTLAEDDDRRGAARVVVLSHALWRDRFGSDPRIVGASLALDGEPFAVVGVMPDGFAYPAGAELWTPLVPGVSELAEKPGVWWMSALGRLKPGVSLAQARRDMAALATSYNREKYQAPGVTAVVTPLAEAVLGPTRQVLLALLGGVGLVLLVACANVAALQLVQVDERAPEMALRLALGASPARIGRALLAESLVLGLLGGSLGVLGALAGVPLLIALSPREVPRLAEASLDATTLAVALGLTLLAAGLGALASIAVGRRRSLRDALAGGSRSLAAGGSRLRTALVAGEVALALVLLVGAGLLLRSFVALRGAPLGFEPRAAAGLRLRRLGQAPPGPRRSTPPRRGAARAGARALPGVEARPPSRCGRSGARWAWTGPSRSKASRRRMPSATRSSTSRP